MKAGSLDGYTSGSGQLESMVSPSTLSISITRNMPRKNEKTPKDILDFLKKNPNATQASIGKALGLTKEATHYYIRGLMASGRLRCVITPIEWQVL